MLKERIVCTVNNTLWDSLNLRKRETYINSNSSVIHHPKRQGLFPKTGNLLKNSLLVNQLTMVRITQYPGKSHPIRSSLYFKDKTQHGKLMIKTSLWSKPLQTIFNKWPGSLNLKTKRIITIAISRETIKASYLMFSSGAVKLPIINLR